MVVVTLINMTNNVNKQVLISQAFVFCHIYHF